MRTFNSLDEYKASLGQEIGVSDWMAIDQKRIQAFADATDDHQWIHLDSDRCKRELNMPTIAHGYLTLSLLPKLSSEISQIKGISRGINYGANKLRFTSMVPVNSRVRARAKLIDTQPKAGGLQCTTEMTIEVEGQERPAMVAETITLLYE